MIDLLKSWFYRNKRDFPWRENRSPYRVWISEVMLQQTRAEVVIDYFNRWMEQFPTIDSVANAHIDEIIKAWEGLGYYSRARNIHCAAKQLKDQFPSTYEELIKIKGFGEYTSGAVLNFAFNKRWPAVDGNVLRVISRLFAIDADIGKSQTKKQIVDKVWELLPQEESWDVSEALIELGATVCKKTPVCGLCPLRFDCKGFKLGTPEAYPIKKKRDRMVDLSRTVAVITYFDQILVNKVVSNKVMAGLWEFPYKESPFDWSAWHPELKDGELLPVFAHTFTKYRAKLFPVLYPISNQHDFPGFTWVSKHDIFDLPFSSGHRKILDCVISRI